MDWQIVITGCGTSHGNPPWGVPELWSEDPRDFRRRSGAMLFGPASEVVLIDLGPDLGAQLRDPWKDWDGHSYPARCVTRCDAVLLTHDHADHCHGTNELRHLNRLMDGAGITIWGLEGHLDELRRMFGYCFTGGGDAYALANPSLNTRAMAPYTTQQIAGLSVTCLPVSHGPAGVTAGFRIQDIAYLTDLKACPPEAMAHLEGLDLLVLDMLREAPHPTHMCWDESRALIEALRPRETILTHMGYAVRYAEWEDRLPEGVVMARDGMSRRFRGPATPTSDR